MVGSKRVVRSGRTIASFRRCFISKLFNTHGPFPFNSILVSPMPVTNGLHSGRDWYQNKALRLDMICLFAVGSNLLERQENVCPFHLDSRLDQLSHFTVLQHPTFVQQVGQLIIDNRMHKSLMRGIVVEWVNEALAEGVVIL